MKIRKSVWFVAFTAVVFMLFSISMASTTTDHKYFVNGKTVDTAKYGDVYIYKDYVFLPATAIVEGMGDKVSLNKSNSTVTFTQKDGTITDLQINKLKGTQNGKTVYVHTKTNGKTQVQSGLKPVFIDNQVYLPYDAYTQLFGYATDLKEVKDGVFYAQVGKVTDVKYEEKAKVVDKKVEKKTDVKAPAPTNSKKLTKDAKTNAEILGKHYGYTKNGYDKYRDLGSAILYDNDGDAALMTTTGHGLEGTLQINYWTNESSLLTKDTLIFFLGEKDGKLIHDKVVQLQNGKKDSKYIDKRVTIGKRLVTISDRPTHVMIIIGKENTKYANNWAPIK